MRLAHIAERIGGTVVGDGDIEITGVAGIREAGGSELTFLANPRYETYLQTTRAGAVVVGPGYAATNRPLILIENPYLGYVRAMKILGGNGRPAPAPGVHPAAVVAPSARLGEGVSIGPGAVLEDGVAVGDRSIVGPHVYVGRDARLGRDCVLHAGTVVRERCVLGDRVILECGSVVGSDGFGYVWDGEKHLKIPHFGHVEVADDVEVGSNATIDRGTTGVTRIGRGTKIDNLVQVAHNVQIGEHCLLAAQVGVSGSTQLDDRVTLAGQVGLVGHIQVGEGAFLAAQSGLDKNVPPGSVWLGSPAKERGRVLREQAAIGRLPELLKRVRMLEERIRELEKNPKT